MKTYFKTRTALLAALSLIGLAPAIASEIRVLKEPVGDRPFCKVFQTGTGACDFYSLKECQASAEGTTEICLPRKAEATPSMRVSEKSETNGKLTEKQSKELSRFKNKDALINPLAKIPGNPNRFDKSTLYVMKNFTIVQKLKDGYLITSEPLIWPSGNMMDFGLAFLKTTKKLTPELLISGAVYYAGDFQYAGMNGFQQSVPLLKIPGGLPISAIRIGGDPFKPDYY